VDVGGRDLGMPDRDAQLVLVRHDVSGGIKTVDRGALMIIHLQAPALVARRSQGDRQFGTNVAAERGIEKIHVLLICVRHGHGNPVFRPPGISCDCENLDARRDQPVPRAERLRGAGRKHGYVPHVGSQKPGFLRGLFQRAEHPDPPVGRLVAVANRAVSDRVGVRLVLFPFDARGFVDKPGGQQDETRLDLRPLFQPCGEPAVTTVQRGDPP
jgi:hypothetical protein